MFIGLKKIKNESNEIFMNMAMFDYLEFINNSYFINNNKDKS